MNNVDLLDRLLSVPSRSSEYEFRVSETYCAFSGFVLAFQNVGWDFLNTAGTVKTMGASGVFFGLSGKSCHDW